MQGVCFRYYSQEKARALGITGWVRNLDSGEVELVAEGTEEQLNAMLEWCRKGPPYALVRNVQIEYAPATNEFTGFEITY